MKMTLHRALAELKLIDSKISKATYNLTPVGLKRRDKKVNDIHDHEEFVKQAKSQYQSINDLIDRKIKIKSALVKANASTLVEIGDMEMTISDAINYKNIIHLKKDLVYKLDSCYKEAISHLNTQNEKIKAAGLSNAKVFLSRQEGDLKPTDKDFKAIYDPFVERNEVLLVDPLNSSEEAKRIEDQINTFETEIDAILSEINAITFIEIDD